MTPSLAAIDAVLAKRAACASATLERVMCGAEFAGIAASKLQTAICRAADGRAVGDALDAAGLERYFGVQQLPATVPALVVLVCGVRSGKSFMAACAAIKSCLTADLGKLQKQERPRFAIVAPTVDNAKATFTMLLGIVQKSPALRGAVVRYRETPMPELHLRRPDGRIVEIVVVAAHRGGTTLRSRWLIGFVLEEVALFGEQSVGAAVTGEELLRAAEPRLLPGAQGWVISSPFGETGFLWSLYKEHFGRPGRTLVVHAPTLAMNPATVTPEMVEAVRQRDPDAAAREYDAVWLEGESSMMSGAAVDACMAHRRDRPIIPREKGVQYVAAMDAATRGNAWTLVVLSRQWRLVDADTHDYRCKDVVVRARQWAGAKAKPLDPKLVMREIAETCAEYGLDEVFADEYGSDFVRSIGQDAGVSVVLRSTSSAERLDRFVALAADVQDGGLELPHDAWMRSDLVAVKKIVRQGSIQIVLPVTPDGRHCDYAPALVLARSRRPPDPPAPEKPMTLEQRAQLEMQQEIDRRNAEAKRVAARGPRFDGPPPRFGGGGGPMPRFGRAA